MLFITNGDSAAGRIERAGFTTEIVPWRDVLHEGPVPAGLSLKELGEVRARFIADQGWAGFEETAENFASRNVG